MFSPGKASDEELVIQFRDSGNMELLGVLFSRYNALVYGVCLKYLKDRDTAKDAVMQVFEKLSTSLRQHPIEVFKGWLYVTTKNHCLMYLRAEKRTQRAGISQEFVENEALLHLEEEEPLEQNLSKLEKCIEELAGEQKQCIQLFYLQERCYKDISTLTGFDFNKVKSHIQNGKRNLKICLEQGD